MRKTLLGQTTNTLIYTYFFLEKEVGLVIARVNTQTQILCFCFKMRIGTVVSLLN